MFLRSQGRERLVGVVGVLKGDRGRAVVSDDISENLQVVYHAALKLLVVIDNEGNTGQQQGNCTGHHRYDGELVSQRNVF